MEFKDSLMILILTDYEWIGGSSSGSGSEGNQEWGEPLN